MCTIGSVPRPAPDVLGSDQMRAASGMVGGEGARERVNGNRTFLLDGRDGVRERVVGRQLSTASSDDGQRQRWQEVSLYRTADGRYVVHTRGCTRVPGETTRARVIFADSPFTVIELLTVRHRLSRELFLPRPAQFALADAAQTDDGIRDAYVNRAVGTS
jgi:hypothetical protein